MTKITNLKFFNKKTVWSYAYLIPTFVLLGIFNYYPIISAFYHSLCEWDIGLQAEFVGLKNFRSLFFSDQIFLSSLKNMALLSAFKTIVEMIVPLLVAELIFSLENDKAKYWYRVLFVFPMVVIGMVVWMLWQFIYRADVGLLNQVLELMGLQNYTHSWIGETKTALVALMFMGFPFVRVFHFLIFYVALENIPTSVLDAAELDGSMGMKRFFHIDLPLLMGQIKVVLMLSLIFGLQSFEFILAMTEGGPGYSTMVPGMYLYQNAFSFNRMGYACAVGVTMFIIIFSLSYLNVKYIKSQF